MTLMLRAALAALLLLLGAPAHGAEPGRAQFEAGVAAYRSGDTDSALRAFQAARAAGYDTPQLRFNLGLCHYRLGRYAEARAEFEALRRDAGYAGIADFHLGLVAAREGDRDRARRLWGAIEAGPDAALAQRAGVALGRLDEGPAEPEAFGYLLVAAGYDTNPALLDEGLQPADGGESPEVELFGAFSWPVAGAARAFTALRGGAFVRDYTEDIGQDQLGAYAGLARELDDGQRRLAFGLDASHSTFDGEPFLDLLTVHAQRTPRTGAGWRVDAQASLVAAADAYAHLEGWRARAGVARLLRTGGARLRLGYDLEFNDREDLSAGSEFSSHSPLRQRLEAVSEHAAGARTTLRWSLRYRHSRHADADRYLDGAVVREERRVDRLAQAGVQARRRLAGWGNALVEYQYSRNVSTIPGYDYDRHLVLLGFEFLPAQ